MRWLIIIGLLLLAILQYRLWIADDGWQEYAELQQAVAGQTAENATLGERNERLKAEVRDLKQGLAAIEERARSELGMIREDETFFQLVEPTTAGASAADRDR